MTGLGSRTRPRVPLRRSSRGRQHPRMFSRSASQMYVVRWVVITAFFLCVPSVMMAKSEKKSVLNLKVKKERTYAYPVDVYQAEDLGSRTEEQSQTRNPRARWQRAMKVVKETRVTVSMICYLYFCVTVEIPLTVLVYIVEEIYAVSEDYHILSTIVASVIWGVLLLMIYEKFRAYFVKTDDKQETKRRAYPHLAPLYRLQALRQQHWLRSLCGTRAADSTSGRSPSSGMVDMGTGPRKESKEAPRKTYHYDRNGDKVFSACPGLYPKGDANQPEVNTAMENKQRA